MIHLVCRSLWEGPTGKRVRHFDAPSLLGWFQQIWVRAAADPNYLAELCGGVIYGFHSLFVADEGEPLPPPTSIEELRWRVENLLYVEGSARLIDEHELCVFTDDDEVDIVYRFFDDTLPDECTAWALHEGFELPEDASPLTAQPTFEPSVPVMYLEPRGDGQGTTYIVFLAGYDSSTADLDGFFAFDGIRLPDLADHLCRIEPNVRILRKGKRKPPTDRASEKYWAHAKVITDWPRELLLLRSQFSDERTLEAALRGCNTFPVYDVFANKLLETALLGPLERARRTLYELAAGYSRSAEDAGRTALQITPHLVQMAMKVECDTAFHQWFFFDDLWARAHPVLAQGLFRWATNWEYFNAGSFARSIAARKLGIDEVCSQICQHLSKAQAKLSAIQIEEALCLPHMRVWEGLEILLEEGVIQKAGRLQRIAYFVA